LAIWTSQKQTPQILKAADAWRQKCLLHDGSIFSDQNLWTKQNIGDLRKLFVDNPILGADKSFYDKLHEQIGNAKPEICQLASEAIWLLLLFVYEGSVGIDKKRERIAEVWKFSGETLPGSEQLADDCLKGLANPGISFLTRMWLEYGFLLVVMEAWKSLPSSEQSRLLSDNPWDLCQWVTNLAGGDVRGFRHMFLYFCYPASFERICSRNHKKQIYTAFARKLEGRQDAYKIDQSPCGLDKSIFELRQALQSEYDTSELDFYRPPLRAQWQKIEEVSEYQEASVRPEEPPATFDAADRTWEQRAGVEKRVRETIERSIPNETTRRAALNFLAFAIENEDEERGSAWYVRETTHGLRLITGRLLAFAIGRAKMRVSVIGPIDDGIRGALGAETEEDAEFKEVPGGLILTFPVDHAGSSRIAQGWAEQLH
jgi:hypothetical protein